MSGYCQYNNTEIFSSVKETFFPKIAEQGNTPN